MTCVIRFVRDTVDDFQSIANYIEQDNPDRALSFIDELQRRTVDLLSQTTMAGRLYKGEARLLHLADMWHSTRWMSEEKLLTYFIFSKVERIGNNKTS